MPQLGKYRPLLNSVFFLYPNIESAQLGDMVGGTGFFVALYSKALPGRFYLYAVTNYHNIDSTNHPTIRVNTKSNEIKIITSAKENWYFIPNSYDIAVYPITGIDLEELDIRVIELESLCLKDEDIKSFEIDQGEDIFMVGRFVSHDGGSIINIPSMRFGNISVMQANVKNPVTGSSVSSIIVDMHSKGGYSGSPVFVYRTIGSIFAESNVIMTGGHLMKLLGIFWGTFPERCDVEVSSIANANKQYVETLSGMGLVYPASAILEVLNLPALKVMREQAEKDLIESTNQSH